ncbi:hypothetical protein CHH67_15235 [Paenibacillus campinasensis]|uniref:Uncharacterized protein n=1 Tax=Paenibacillus campinasensis TaxID=66347 RepID=A0A268EQ37_9BACL|nr:hypothetical protein CHH67_15235 [Paenibacillus campinasensis]
MKLGKIIGITLSIIIGLLVMMYLFVILIFNVEPKQTIIKMSSISISSVESPSMLNPMSSI